MSQFFLLVVLIGLFLTKRLRPTNCENKKKCTKRERPNSENPYLSRVKILLNHEIDYTRVRVIMGLIKERPNKSP